jgi:general secretion pathway protein A
MAPDREIFPQRVVRGIYHQTRGIPRLINLLCDRILLGAYGRNRSRADMDMLRLATREVMGEELKQSSSSGWGSWVAALLVLALGLGGYVMWQRAERGGVEVAAVEVAAEVNPDPPPAAATPDQPPAPVTDELPQVSPTAEAPVEAVPLASPAVPVLLPPAEAMAALWALHSNEPYRRDPCAGARVAELACVRDRAQTWDQLAALDRPVLLDMVTAYRFAAGAVLLGLDGRNTWVVDAEGGVSEVALSSLASGWSGDYRYLWRPPAGFDKPLSRGDRGDVVREVAALFARLDGQSQALTDDLFNQGLEQRVKMFQRANGLEDDGVVGAQTLLKLNAALGVDPSARALRQSLATTAGTLD